MIKHWGTPSINPFITMKCNYDCEYCIVRQTPGHNDNFDLLSGGEWIEILNALEDVENYIFNGGEPTLHPDFVQIIDGLKPCNHIGIGTNLATEKSFQKLLSLQERSGGELIIDVSLHPDANIPKIIERVKKLRDKNRARVHIVDWPGWFGMDKLLKKQIQQAGIETFILPFQGFYKGEYYPGADWHDLRIDACSRIFKKNALCYPTIYRPVGPDGSVWFCHAGLYMKDERFIMGNLADGWLDFPTSFKCDIYGYCNSCDLPRKIEVLDEN